MQSRAVRQGVPLNGRYRPKQPLEGALMQTFRTTWAPEHIGTNSCSAFCVSIRCDLLSYFMQVPGSNLWVVRCCAVNIDRRVYRLQLHVAAAAGLMRILGFIIDVRGYASGNPKKGMQKPLVGCLYDTVSFFVFEGLLAVLVNAGLRDSACSG